MHPLQDLIAQLEAARQHHLEHHGDDDALDLARSYEDTLHDHARWQAEGRDLRERVIDQVDNVRSFSERERAECLLCRKAARRATDALSAATGRPTP